MPVWGKEVVLEASRCSEVSEFFQRGNMFNGVRRRGDLLFLEGDSGC